MRRRFLVAATVLGVAGVALMILRGLTAPPDVRSLVAFAAWKRLPWNAPEPSEVPVRGVVLHTETYGEGDPVLLMHGAFGFSRPSGTRSGRSRADGA